MCVFTLEDDVGRPFVTACVYVCSNGSVSQKGPDTGEIDLNNDWLKKNKRGVQRKSASL